MDISRGALFSNFQLIQMVEKGFGPNIYESLDWKKILSWHFFKGEADAFGSARGHYGREGGLRREGWEGR